MSAGLSSATENLTKLRLARATGGVVVTTPSSLKSLYLAFVESMHPMYEGLPAPAPGLLAQTLAQVNTTVWQRYD